MLYPDQTFEIPKDAELILNVLTGAGHEAFVVGGCVRDVMLHRTPGDWDITTSATPEQVKGLFHKTIDTGIEHGTVTVMIHHVGYEVTTYRIDGEYEDGRHPKSVEFTKNLVEDLKRRDFTINALAYNPSVGLVDEFGGIEDLERKVIRCVGNPLHRFTEDALRILRAIRFSAQLDFTIEDETLSAISQIAPNLLKVSHERIRVEMHKLICSAHPEKIALCESTGITDHVLCWLADMKKTPMDENYQAPDLLLHSIAVMQKVPAERELRWAALLHEIGRITEHPQNAQDAAELAGKILKDLRFDNKTIHTVKALVLFQNVIPQTDRISVRESIFQIGKQLYPLYLQLQKAKISCMNSTCAEQGLAVLDEIEKQYLDILEQGECTEMKELAIRGADLISAGIPKGPVIGDILNGLLQEVLKDPSLNQKEKLLSMAEKYIQK